MKFYQPRHQFQSLHLERLIPCVGLYLFSVTQEVELHCQRQFHQFHLNLLHYGPNPPPWDLLVPFSDRGYRDCLLDELSSPGTEGFSSSTTSFPHVAADTPPVRTAVSDSFGSVLVAFARYRPSQPPDLRVTRLRLRSLYVTTWSFANVPIECLSESSMGSLSFHDASQATEV